MSQKSGSKKSGGEEKNALGMMGGKKEEEKKEDQGPPKTVTMPAGDYICHLLIQQGKNFILDGEDSCDPLVKVKMLDKENQTTFKKGIAQTSIVKWDEQIFIEFEGLKEEELKKGTIMISIWNKGYFSDTKIGEFEIPIATVYSSNDHLMEHQMLGFNLPESSDAGKITGNLAVTIHLQGPGDDGKQLTMGSDKDIYAKAPLIPLSIKKQYKQAYLRILRAENLPKVDMFNLNDLQGGGTIDAYFMVKFGDSKPRTKVITEKSDGKHEVVWMEEFLLPIEIPIKNEDLPIELWDQDVLFDEKICTYILSIKELMKYDEDQGKGKIKKMTWLNMYGGPVGYSNGYFKWMNENPEGATQWKGRILVEYWSENDKFAKAKIHHLKEEEIVKEIAEKMPLKQYFIIGEIGSGIALPDSKKYSIKISIGKYEILNQAPKQTEKQLCRWDIKFEKTIDDSYESVYKLPDIFVYLCLDDAPIAYYREACSQFDEPNSVLKWYPFKPDFAVGQLKDGYKAGLFSMRLYIRSVTDNGIFNQSIYKNWSIGFPKRNRAWKIRAAIYQCQSLQAANENGQSDPFVEIWSPDSKATIHTHFCEQTNNPLYYELKEFYMEFNKKQEAPPLIFNVFQKDQGFFTTNDKYMARSIIYLKDVENLSQNNEIPYPEWFPLKYDVEDPWDEQTGARILIAFSLVDYDFNYMVPSNKIELEKKFKIADDRRGNPIYYPMPDLRIKEFACTIMVLGLRELISNGILPIRKAFVKFNLKSLLKTEMAKAVSNIQTLPKDTGPNPNLRQTMQFEVKLPEDETFCPEMTCEAYDMLFFEGMPQPQIGSFTLKVGKTLFDQIEQDEDKLRKLQRLKLILMEVQKRQISNQAIGERIRVADLVNEIEPEVDSGKISGELDIPQKLKDMINQIFIKDKSRSQYKSNTKSQISKIKKEDPGNLDDHQAARKALKMLGSSLRKQLELQAKKQLEEKERQQAEIRAQAQKELASKREGFEDVLLPIYKFDERLGIDVEVEMPPDTLFLPVGYNPETISGKKHYRRYFPYSMEKVKNEKGEFVIEKTFIAEKISRAQIKKNDGGGFFGGLFGVSLPPVDKSPELNVVQVGIFKGVLTVGNEVETKVRKDAINDLISSIHKDIENIYNQDLNSTGKTFQYDMEQLNPEKIESYEKMQKSLNEIHSLLKEAGLGKLNIDKAISTFLYDVQLSKKLKMQFQCKTKIYILDGFNFAQRDYFSQSDAYLIVRSGQVEYNERQNYQLNTASPQFHKCFEFTSDLPGSYAIEIHAYDYDDFFGDSLIGSTLIDVEGYSLFGKNFIPKQSKRYFKVLGLYPNVDDRFFSQGWQSLTKKPIEYRELKIPTSGMPQGVVKLWCEINETTSMAANEPPMDITPEPLKNYELQVTVWKCVDIEPMDFEGASDVYCRAYFDPAQDKFTDTHWRVFDGKCSFNWRLIIPIKSKWPNYNLTLQAWDRDIISSNELLGEFVIDIGPLVNDVILTEKQMNMSHEYWQTWMKQKLLDDGYKNGENIKFESREKQEEKFWIPLRRFNKKEQKIIEAGEMQVTIHLVPIDHVEKFPQGEGREAPNSEPFCPEPEGRIQLSINPFAMFNQLVPPALRRKILCALCCLIYLALCVYMGPQIFSNLITYAITQIFPK